MEKVNLAHKLSLFHDTWNPRIVGELNGQHVMLTKLEGEFEWHHHQNEDELFLVLSGELDIHFRERVVTLKEGELLIVPRGVEHKPESKHGAEVLMFEPVSTLNTGNWRDERTVESPDWI